MTMVSVSITPALTSGTSGSSGTSAISAMRRQRRFLGAGAGVSSLAGASVAISGTASAMGVSLGFGVGREIVGDMVEYAGKLRLLVVVQA